MRKLFCVLLACSLTPSAMAAMVTYRFTATAVDTWGAFEGQGTQVTGTVSFDDALPDQLPGFSTTDTFSSTGFAATISLGTAGGSVSDGSVSITDALGTQDSIQFSIGLTGPNLFLDASGDLFPGQANLTNTMSGAMQIFDTLDFAHGQYDGAYTVRDGDGSLVDGVSFQWTSFERVASVPLPAAFWLLVSGLLGLFGAGARARL